MVYRRVLTMGVRCMLAIAVLLGALGMGAPAWAEPPAGWTVDAFDPFPDSHVVSIAVQPDGKILIGGFFGMVGDLPRPHIARLNPDGSLDDVFAPPIIGPSVHAIALDGDGKIVVAGDLYALDHIGRLHPDGTLDEAFTPESNGWIYALAIQPDGRILVGGNFSTIAGGSRSYVARLHPDGTLDESFDVLLDAPFVYALAVQPDGKILMGGTFQTVNDVEQPHLARLHPDGTLDETFAVTVDDTVHAIALQAAGHILLGGAFANVNGQPRPRFARLMPEGTLDDLAPGLAPSSGPVYSIASDADGRIMLGGLFSWLPQGATDHLANLAIIDTNGDLVADPILHVNGPVSALALQADGALLVGGQFSEMGRIEDRWCMARLSNPTPAAQTLTYYESSRLATWHRSGSSPGVWRTTLEVSTDGVNYALLAEGTRIKTGWEWEELYLTPGRDLWLRARGYYTTGGHNASASIVEEITTLHLEWDPMFRYVPIAMR